jgi:hypothetical protein
MRAATNGKTTASPKRNEATGYSGKVPELRFAGKKQHCRPADPIALRWGAQSKTQVSQVISLECREHFRAFLFIANQKNNPYR